MHYDIIHIVTLASIINTGYKLELGEQYYIYSH